MVEIKPYKSLEDMKYGEVDIFTHQPIVREIKNSTKFTIRLTTDELYYLDEDGYPTKSEISLLYKPSGKVIDRKTFKMLLSKLRNERLSTHGVIEYVSNFMNKLVSPKHMSISLSVVKPFKERKKYMFTEENNMPVIENNRALYFTFIDPYKPIYNLTQGEEKIFSTKRVETVKVSNRDQDGYINREILSCTFLNKYSGFPEFCNLRTEIKVRDKTLDPTSSSFENMIRKVRYTYLTEEEFVNYVAFIIHTSLDPMHFNIQCSFNPRGSVGYDLYFIHQSQ